MKDDSKSITTSAMQSELQHWIPSFLQCESISDTFDSFYVRPSKEQPSKEQGWRSHLVDKEPSKPTWSLNEYTGFLSGCVHYISNRSSISQGKFPPRFEDSSKSVGSKKNKNRVRPPLTLTFASGGRQHGYDDPPTKLETNSILSSSSPSKGEDENQLRTCNSSPEPTVVLPRMAAISPLTVSLDTEPASPTMEDDKRRYLGRDFHPTNRNLHTTKRNLHPMQRELHPTQQNLYPTQQDWQLTQGDFHSSQRDLESSQRDLHSSRRDLHPTQRDSHLTMPKSKRHETTAPSEKMFASMQQISTTEKNDRPERCFPLSAGALSPVYEDVSIISGGSEDTNLSMSTSSWSRDLSADHSNPRQPQNSSPKLPNTLWLESNSARRLVCRCENAYGWSQDFTIAVLMGYFQFLETKTFLGDFDDKQLLPSTPVDLMWKQHILDVVQYVHDTEWICGQMIGRNPENEALTKRQRAQLIKATKIALRARYGDQSIDRKVWDFTNKSEDSVSVNEKDHGISSDLRSTSSWVLDSLRLERVPSLKRTRSRK